MYVLTASPTAQSNSLRDHKGVVRINDTVAETSPDHKIRVGKEDTDGIWNVVRLPVTPPNS